MRTTVTLDPDVAARVKRLAKERGIPFKEALNSTLRAGLGADMPSARPYRVRARNMGLRPGVDLDKALRLAATLEDEATLRKLELRK
jgi:hypothetical protein